jgi:hypothetical protein
LKEKKQSIEEVIVDEYEKRSSGYMATKSKRNGGFPIITSSTAGRVSEKRKMKPLERSLFGDYVDLSVYDEVMETEHSTCPGSVIPKNAKQQITVGLVKITVGTILCFALRFQNQLGKTPQNMWKKI